MEFTRRHFLKLGATAAAVIAAPRPLMARLGGAPEPVPPIEDPRLRGLVQRALDAARSAGATYADVRLTHTRRRTVNERLGIMDSEEMFAGVRALVDGYWGFASSPIWSPDELVRLGREAAYQAKVNLLGATRDIALAQAPAIPQGSWEAPVEIDPFEIYPVEVLDYLVALSIFARRVPLVDVKSNACRLQLQEKAFGSTEGSYFTQRLRSTGGDFVIELSNEKRERVSGGLDTLGTAGVGFELYKGQPIRENIRQLIEELKAELALPVRPVDVGRYDTVFDAASVAALASSTIGLATELDRALGYEANAGGTSYLNDPGSMLGSFQVGAPALTVTANRTERGGLATAKWDDDGVATQEFPLVQEGVLAGFQTTRESAGWLGGQGGGTGSRGCAHAPSAEHAPITHTCNLRVAPGAESLGFDGLVAGLKDGMAYRRMQFNMDFQQSNGYGTGAAYRVKDGKVVSRVANSALLFRATDLWKSVRALGGKESARRYPQGTRKGQPQQDGAHSVTAVPALLKEVTIIDAMRKA